LAYLKKPIVRGLETSSATRLLRARRAPDILESQSSRMGLHAELPPRRFRVRAKNIFAWQTFGVDFGRAYEKRFWLVLSLYSLVTLFAEMGVGRGCNRLGGCADADNDARAKGHYINLREG
jgi:hypothetical protein